MTAKLHNIAARLMRDQSGQTIVMLSLMLVVVLAAAGFAIDVGRAMVVNNELKSSTIAAALAGANEMPNSDFATVAKEYSGCSASASGSTGCTTAGNNSSTMLGTVTTAATGYCSSFVSSTLDIGCTSMGGTSSANALVVTQTVTMPTLFMSIFGIDSVTFSDSQTAAWRGAARNPYNVAVIVDTTESMNTADTGSDGCNDDPSIECALDGVQTLLQKLTPCAGGGSCGTGYTPLDEVALYTFPGLSNTSAASDDATCNAQINGAGSSNGGFGVNDSTTYYGFPGSSFSGSALMPSPPVYQIVGFSSNYKSSDSSSSLNTSSTLVEAAGGGSSTCQYNSISTGYGKNQQTTYWGGIQAVGGAGTYYAGVIYQAQNDLYNEYESRLNAGTQTQNVMVILSDGDASSTNVKMGGDEEGCTEYYESGSKKGQCETEGEVLTDNSNSSGSYASYDDQCTQAVDAAEDATNGTWPSTQSTTSPVKTTVYTVAYGSETGTCPNDTLSPCQTMEQMASSYTLNQQNSTLYPNAQLDFYSDYLNNATGGADQSCTSSNDITSIPDIFTSIADNLSTSKIMQTPSGCSASNTSSCD